MNQLDLFEGQFVMDISDEDSKINIPGFYDDVEIEYQNTKLNSNNVIIDWETNFLYAKSDENNSQISSQNQKPIIGKNLEFDLIAKKGIITLGKTSVGDGIYKSKTIFDYLRSNAFPIAFNRNSLTILLNVKIHGIIFLIKTYTSKFSACITVFRN